jgi:hypothetical protein
MALPDKKLLQDKLHELVQLWENQKREEIWIGRKWNLMMF